MAMISSSVGFFSYGVSLLIECACVCDRISFLASGLYYKYVTQKVHLMSCLNLVECPFECNAGESRVLCVFVYLKDTHRRGGGG